MTTPLFTPGRTHLKWILAAVGFALLGCAEVPLTEPDSDTAEEELRFGPRLLQAGDGLVALGVTDDQYVLYWSAGQVLATNTSWGLRAPLRVTAAAEPPLTMVVGNIALIWTGQRFDGQAAPSPLVVWTAAHGAKLAASASWPSPLFGINAGSAIGAGGEVLFTAGVSADGATGDIVLASADLSRRTTLVRGASVHPFGACPPHVGFDAFAHPQADRPGAHLAARAVVVACAGGNESAAVLARWQGGVRQELSRAIAPGSFWTTDPDGDLLLASRSDRATVLFDRAGTATVIEARPSSGWIAPDDGILTRVRTSPSNVALQRTTLAPLRTTLVYNLGAAAGVMFANHLPHGINHYDRTTLPLSPDGSFFGGFSGFDPNTGLTDVYMVGLSGAPVLLRAAKDVLPSFELATPDSRHLLYYTYDVTTGQSTLYAGARSGRSRRLSSGNTGLAHLGLAAGQIVFADRVTNPERGLLSSAELRVVDVNVPSPVARTLVTHAHPLFFALRGRRTLVYTTEAGEFPGLYLTDSGLR